MSISQVSLKEACHGKIMMESEKQEERMDERDRNNAVMESCWYLISSDCFLQEPWLWQLLCSLLSTHWWYSRSNSCYFHSLRFAFVMFYSHLTSSGDLFSDSLFVVSQQSQKRSATGQLTTLTQVPLMDVFILLFFPLPFRLLCLPL